MVTTIAGGGTISGTIQGGYLNGQGLEALFHSPTSIAIGPNSFLFVADSGNNLIRKISPAGECWVSVS